MDPFFSFFDKYRGTYKDFAANSLPEFSSKKIHLSKIVKLSEEKIEGERNILKILQSRKSADFPLDKQKSFSFETLSNLLSLSTGVKASDQKRVYPSGGAKYPVGIYLMVFDVDNLDSGLYLYAPDENVLKEISLFSKEKQAEVKNNLFLEYQDTNFIIHFSFEKNRSHPKYGSLSYKLALLEAGHIAQNFLLIGTLLNLQNRPTLTFDYPFINNLFNLDTDYENIFYSIVFAK